MIQSSLFAGTLRSLARTTHFGLAVATTLTVAAPEPVVADSAPTGREVVERFIDRLGGASAVSSVDSFHATGSYELPAHGLAGTIDLFFAAPDKLVFDVRIEGFGRSARGTDGTTFWSIDPQQGARVLEGDEVDVFRKWLARGFSLLPRLGSYSEIGAARLTECGGRPCYEVDLTLKGTESAYQERYDVESGLLVERTERSQLAGQDVVLEGWVSDYRVIGDLRVASTWKHRAAGQEWTATYESVKFGDVDDSVFELPDEIRDLVVSARD